MPKSTARERVAFATTLLACAAFLVGAVRVWGVSTDRLASFFITLLLFVFLIMLLALLFTGLRLLVKKWLRR